MTLSYAPFTPAYLQCRYCPLCTSVLADAWDADGLFRPTCAACGWVYYPPNVLAVAVVVTTAEGIVFLLPPEEPPETPAALPAGCVEFGEPLDEAARREVREETGLHVAIVRELPGRVFRPDRLGGHRAGHFTTPRRKPVRLDRLSRLTLRCPRRCVPPYGPCTSVKRRRGDPHASAV